MRGRLLKILAWLWVAAVLTVVPGLRLAQWYLDTPRDPKGGPQVVQIPSGMSLRQISLRLAKAGIINHPETFFVLTRIMGQGRKMKHGEYKLWPSLSPREVLEVIRKGTPLQYRVTFPEGLTMAEIGAELESQGLVDREAFMEQAADAELSTSLGIPALNVEGYLFPDTYYFSRGMSAQAIIRKMVDRFREVFGQVKALGEQKTRLTDFQTVILASLVEAETNADQERALVAGVFVARLKKKMLLQCDPTVIYGLENFNGNITKEDLADPHPYNTYVHPGLPPGPIGNPGRASLEAALYPADTKHLYFVSKNDGTHHFSETYSKHQAAVRKYQR